MDEVYIVYLKLQRVESQLRRHDGWFGLREGMPFPPAA